MTQTTDSILLNAQDVTGTLEMTLEIPPGLNAAEAARSTAAYFGLPEDTEYSLRDNRSAGYLRDEVPIGEQVEPGASVTVTPKTHLG